MFFLGQFSYKFGEMEVLFDTVGWGALGRLEA